MYSTTRSQYEDIRILAFDDGYFPPSYKARRGKTLLVGVYTSKKTIIEAIAYKLVTVDGRETTGAIIEIAKYLPGSTILLDGITYAGFDVVDPNMIHNSTGATVVVLQQYPLNLSRIKTALEKHFEDHEERYMVIEETYKKMRYLQTPWKTIQYYVVPETPGITKLLRELMIYSPVPEPLRIAHIVASTTSREMHYKGMI